MRFARTSILALAMAGCWQRFGVGPAFLLGSDSQVGLVLKLTLGLGGSY